MIPIDKGEKPSILDSPNCVERIKLNLANQEFKGTYYKHETVLQALEEIYHGKCGYCESMIRPVATPQVDHFRPKIKVKEAPEHSGYYWLGHEWSNLILACPACNNAKSSHFPVNGHRVAVPSLLPDGDLDTSRCLPSQSPLQDEESVLIHPEIEETVDHFRFHINGSIEGVTQRGARVIDICRLNRSNLGISRKRIVDDHLATVDLLFVGYIEGLLEREQLLSLLALWMNRIANECGPHSVYSLFKRYALEHFDEFYINQSVSETQRSVMQEIHKTVFGD
jgi:5-methylcytosine-specific restriction endonuclease McrA